MIKTGCKLNTQVETLSLCFNTGYQSVDSLGHQKPHKNVPQQHFPIPPYPRYSTKIIEISRKWYATIKGNHTIDPEIITVLSHFYNQTTVRQTSSEILLGT